MKQRMTFMKSCKQIVLNFQQSHLSAVVSLICWSLQSSPLSTTCRMSWSATALSDSLEAKERLLIGRKFLNATCKPTFFSAGKRNASFHASGK